MRRFFIIALILSAIIFPVSAQELSPPQVPEIGQKYMPEDTQSFSQGLWYILQQALQTAEPAFYQALKMCVGVIAVALLQGILSNWTGADHKALDFVSVLMIGLLLIDPARSMIRLASSTVRELTEYAKLLFPVLSAAMAAQGSIGASTALYMGTSAFVTVLTQLISAILIPVLYLYLALSIAYRAIGEKILQSLQSFLKWGFTWILKILLYVFTGYLAMTGVIHGSTDAAALKATKIAISGMVPVVGGILSDASESILVSAGLMKNAAGIYGVLAMLAVFVSPFVQIGLQYLMLKLSAAICDLFSSDHVAGLVHDMSGAMGMILAVTGSVCLLLLIGTVCYLKGVGI